MNRPQKLRINRTLGVIVCFSKEMNRIPPFGESAFFRKLAEEARPLHFDLIIFNPKWVDWKQRSVQAWFLNAKGNWTSGTRNLPNLIYDRCFYQNLKQYKSYKPAILKLRNDPDIRLLGRPLGGKIQTYEILKQNEIIAPHLPETVLYQSPKDVFAMLTKHETALIKPNGGSHGIGVVGITPKEKGYILRGRTEANKPFHQELTSATQLAKWLEKFVGQTRYIVQPFLSLSTTEGIPFDLRILLQKNERRLWEQTGLAIRRGKSTSITSNLHGGGDAEKVGPFIEKHFPPFQVDQIWHQIDLLSFHVPMYIEENHGSLVELGLDLGIDQSGKVWILELNSKPGRSVFLRTGETEIRKRAIQLPILYANSLLTGQLGGKT
ncbi:YheC/YheD family endospore coat-associated protein [Risungbinella massiliensis]|uniref:YheC/YheD family endospore coat-associated protein n=1 Tax=Risungbinella massiliensis TaxID=1329796 RepID=UPI00069984D3|nr:YheC/YheD family protein [Risungbinella massiliensis]